MPIHYDKRDDHIVVITIDRPEARNSLDLYHFRDLAQAWKDFRYDDDLWLAIVTGGPGQFMSGADLKTYIPQVTELATKIGSGEVNEIDGCRLEDGTRAVLRNVKIYKPIVAAIDGPCVAGGMEMLGGVDIRIATPNAIFGVMEPKRGLFAGGGTTARLPRQLNFPAAMEFLTKVQTGDLPCGFFQSAEFGSHGANYGWGIGTCILRAPHEGVAAMLSPGTFGHGGAWGTQAWIDPVRGVACVLMVQRSDFDMSDATEVRRAFQQAASDALAHQQNK